MSKSKYAAGLHFVVGTSDQALSREDRKSVRSHARKAQGKRRKAVQLQSWIGSNDKLECVKTIDSWKPSVPSFSSPRRIDGDFSALQLPTGIEPTMIQELVKLIQIDQHGIYPYDVCLRVHPVERGWFPYIVSDICCIHSMMFSVQAFLNQPSRKDQLSLQAAEHYAQTLRILQARINTFDQVQRDGIYCDSTIMVITFLINAAELMRDFASMKNHTEGLLKIVSLRGGMSSLSTHNNLQVKVCRADLGLALRLGSRPHLFRNDIVWDCYIAKSGVIRCNHQPYKDKVHTFANALDVKLGNCWKDLHAFSCMSNLAYQTTRKLSPDTYNETVISILYRLIHLSFENDVLNEAIRLGLLTFSSTLFMTRLYERQPYKRLCNLFEEALTKLLESTSIAVAEPVLFWLMLLYHVVASERSVSDDWRRTWLKQAISINKVDTWSKGVLVLKSVMWVDFVHGAPGEKILRTVMNQMEESHATKIELAQVC